MESITPQQAAALAQPIVDEVNARAALLEATGLRRDRAVQVAIMQMAGKLEIISA